MNIVKFMVNTTNIFPLANSVAGGQLLTEYNLRSVDSVGTAEAIKYFVGPSYCHAEEDFAINLQTDEVGTQISNYIIQMNSGRAVVNGHYFESLTSVYVDMTEVNATLNYKGLAPLKGKLTIGLRAMYSTLPTMAGALNPENNEYYEGIQIVILPSEEFKLPIDVPNDPGKVTAHIKLADFQYINGKVVNVVNNYPEKCQHIDANRIKDFDAMLPDIYVRKTGLNPKKLYTFAGKGMDPATGKDTWCDSVDSLMVWDNNPTLTTDKPAERQAQFTTTGKGAVQLVMPHKQVDGITDTAGKPQYYKSRSIEIPLADYILGTPGTINKEYTNHVKNVVNKINEFYHLPNGRMRAFFDTRAAESSLPDINPSWDIGDYIIYGEDKTTDATESGRGPSTMYVVLPGIVTLVSCTLNTKPEGMRLDLIEMKEADKATAPNTDDSATYNAMWNLAEVPYQGEVGKDYFEAIWYPSEGDPVSYYYVVATSGAYLWSSAIWITGDIPYATEATVGGFLNVPEDAFGSGYVFRDDTGHLRVLDYDLLAGGLMAYQLGQDMENDSTLSSEEIQDWLTEFVNQRVAFPNASHYQNATNPNVITLTLNLPREEQDTVIRIEDIDCRFNTSVHIHIMGEADSHTTINISDCQKIRILNDIQGTPRINIARCSLYYDSHVLNELNEISDLQLWYERYEETDPDLIVDGLTVRETNTPVIVEELEFWDEKQVNDNHFVYALHSISFSPDGTIIGCEMLVKNDTSQNIDTNSVAVVAKFELPTGVGLTYPVSRLTKQLKITGDFITAYHIQDPPGWRITNTHFTAITNTNDPYGAGTSVDGVISFYATTEDMEAVNMPEGIESIDGWDCNSFHIFSGGALT